MRPGLKLYICGMAVLAAVLLYAGNRQHWFANGAAPAAPVAQAPVAPVAPTDATADLSADAPADGVASATTNPPAAPAPEPETPSPPRDALDEFTSAILAEAEDAWTPIFAEESDTYVPPRLKYFEGTTRSACSSKGVEGDGTFYCAPERRLYIDKDFHRGMVDRGAPLSSLAQAYVLAHVIGHHVQTLRGIQDRLRKELAGKSERQRKALHTRAELQADCFAGIWAHSAHGDSRPLADADIDQALSLPASIGVELVRRHERRVIVPDPYSHGTLPQRRRWFLAGYRSGLVKDCETFTARRL